MKEESEGMRVCLVSRGREKNTGDFESTGGVQGCVLGEGLTCHS